VLSEVERFILFCSRLSVTLRINREVLSQAKRHKCRILWLGKKINAIYFVLLSTFRNFALSARSYSVSEEKTNEFVLFFSQLSVTL